MGMWVPVHDEEWDGDIPLGRDRPDVPVKDSESGVVTFKDNNLPWITGRYEVSISFSRNSENNFDGTVSTDSIPS